MKEHLLLPILALFSAAAAGAAPAAGHTGLQLWSLRQTQAQQGWSAVLDQAKDLGFTYVEGLSLPPGVTAEAYNAKLASLGLKMISAHFPYGQLLQDLPGTVEQAKALHLRYVVVPWVLGPGQAAFTDDDARAVAANFNRFGAAFKAAGIQFGYHPHGYEFRPDPDGGTPFDVLVKNTDPDLVFLQMDVFWITHAGQNPVELLARYPNRWRMMHLKDIRKGAPTGFYTGNAPATDDVPVGSGQVDWPAVLKEADRVGVQWYFIEDESTSPLQNIPISLAYVNSLGQ